MFGFEKVELLLCFSWNEVGWWWTPPSSGSTPPAAAALIKAHSSTHLLTHRETKLLSISSADLQCQRRAPCLPGGQVTHTQTHAPTHTCCQQDVLWRHLLKTVCLRVWPSGTANMFSGRIASSGCVTAGRDASTSNNTSFDKVAAQSARSLQRSFNSNTLVQHPGRSSTQWRWNGAESHVTISSVCLHILKTPQIRKVQTERERQTSGRRNWKDHTDPTVRTTCMGSLITIIHIIWNHTVRAATSSTARRGRGGERHQTPFKKHSI